MALLFVDGFDHYGTSDILKKWSANTGTISTSGGRRGGGAFTGGTISRGFVTLTTGIAGVAYNPGALPTGSPAVIMQFRFGSTPQVTLAVNASGGLDAYTGNTTDDYLGSTAGSLIPANVFSYIEFKAKIDPTTGTIDIRVNGTAALSLTAQNTSITGGTTFNGVLLSGGTVDDFYLCDTSGSANNNFLGDVRVDMVLPTGDGNYTQWTPSTGTTHYNLVNANPPSTTTYNSSTTVANKDSYVMADLSSIASSTVYGVQVVACALKDDSGSRSIQLGARSGSTDAVGSGQAVSTSAVFYARVMETDPAGAAWTQTSVNSAEALVQVL